MVGYWTAFRANGKIGQYSNRIDVLGTMREKMKNVILVLALLALGCDCGDCDEIAECIDEHEAALEDCPDNPSDGEPFEWPDDCEAGTTPGTDRDIFCEHTAALMECEDDWDDCGC